MKWNLFYARWWGCLVPTLLMVCFRIDPDQGDRLGVRDCCAAPILILGGVYGTTARALDE